MPHAAALTVEIGSEKRQTAVLRGAERAPERWLRSAAVLDDSAAISGSPAAISGGLAAISGSLAAISGNRAATSKNCAATCAESFFKCLNCLRKLLHRSGAPANVLFLNRRVAIRSTTSFGKRETYGAGLAVLEDDAAVQGAFGFVVT